MTKPISGLVALLLVLRIGKFAHAQSIEWEKLNNEVDVAV